MRMLLAGAAGLLFLLFAGAQENDPAVKKDKKLFNGTWKIESFDTEDGKKDDVEGATLSFSADKITFKKGDETKKGSYTINPAGKPKEINLKPNEEEKEILGIYKLEKDTLTMCLCPQPNEARPSEFAAKNPYVLIKLQRVKE